MNSHYRAHGEKILLTLWVGGMWFAGYVVAPVLFNMLDRTTAGQVAGHVFTVTSYIGLVCCAFLILSVVADKSRGFRLWILVVMLVVILLGQFVLSPMMTELKMAGIEKGSENALQFARLHGVSSTLYLVNSVLGLILVVFGIRASDPARVVV